MKGSTAMAASGPAEEAPQHADPPAFQIQQLDALMGLRESIQTPPPGQFSMDDLAWTDHVTTGKGRHKGSKMAFIPWDRLEDFISGEENNPIYPCKFNSEVIRRNLPNSLRSPRAYSPSLVVRSDLLHFNHCSMSFMYSSSSFTVLHSLYLYSILFCVTCTYLRHLRPEDMHPLLKCTCKKC